MFQTIADLQVPYILDAHEGNPTNDAATNGYTDIGLDLVDYFSSRVAGLHRLGAKDIILDRLWFRKDN
jgi:dihydropteroate synthase